MTNTKTNKLGENKKVILVSSLLGVAIVAGYLFLCIIAGGNDFIGNTVINGIDVSKMTKQQAITAINDQYTKDDVKTLTLSVNNDKQFTVNTENILSFDAEKSVDEIFNKQHSSFFGQAMLLFSNSTYSVPVIVKDQSLLENAVKESGVLEYNTSIPTQYNVLDNEVEFIKGKEGVTVSLGSVVKDVTAALNEYKVKEAVECTLEKSGLAEDEMVKIHTELNKECVNATLDKENNYSIVPSQVGVSYSLEDAKKAFSNVKEGESVKVSATVTRPKVTTEDLQNNLFKDVLGTYSTTLYGTDVRKNNLKLAGRKCSGTILLPGEEFSFNKVVGKRTVAAGFGNAPAYVGGQTVDTVGGGICQTASTLYNAALLSNLKITERHAHSYPSAYTPIGLDATVSWGSLDLKFVNNTDYPIKVTCSSTNYKITMKIQGTNLENITVKMTSKQLSSTPYKTIEKEDPTLEVGKTKVSVTGYAAATAQSYRHVYKNGVLISSKKEAYSKYKRRDEVVYVGTKPVAVPPTDPTTPDGDGGTTPTTPSTGE